MRTAAPLLTSTMVLPHRALAALGFMAAALEYLNGDFVEQLLEMIEHKPSSKSQLRLVEQAFALLLAFNRHFALDDVKSNVVRANLRMHASLVYMHPSCTNHVCTVQVMATLATRPCKALGESLMACFNRQAVS